MKKKSFLLIIFLILILSGCKAAPTTALPSSERIVESMDTVMLLTAYGENSNQAIDEATKEISRIDNLLSTENALSEISRLNKLGKLTLSDDSAYLLTRSLELYDLTEGYFDISVYPLSKLWGFPSKKYYVPSTDEIEEVLGVIGLNKAKFDISSKELQLAEGQQIDFGGIAKGYTSQQIMDIFKSNGISSAIVSLGGNVQCLGSKPDGSLWKVGIKKPDIDSSEIIAAVSVENKAVITSGGYERYFKDPDTGVIYKHILDPKSGFPVDNDLLSVTIITDDGTLGDALSTSLFAMGLEKAISFWRDNHSDFQAVFVDNNYHLFVTENLKDNIVTSQSFSLIYAH